MTLRRWLVASLLCVLSPTRNICASVVQGAIVGVISIGSNSVDRLGYFGPAGSILDGKQVSVSYSYDSSQFRGPYLNCPTQACYTYYQSNYYLSNGPFPSSVSITINGITVTSAKSPLLLYNLIDTLYYDTPSTFTQVSGYSPVVEFYAFDLTTNLFGVPLGFSPQSFVYITVGRGGAGDSSFGMDINPCTTMIANSLKPPTLDGGNGISGPTQISAEFTPTIDGTTPYGLANAAKLCHVEKFDWVQIIKSAPDPLPFCVNNSSNSYYVLANPQPFCDQNASSSAPFPLHLTSRSAPLYDPPPNGYDYINIKHPGNPDPDYQGVWDTGPDAYPFYYDTKTSGLPLSLDWPKNTDPLANTLYFHDMPSDPCISDQHGIPGFDYLHFPSIQARCGNSYQSVFAPPYHVTPTNTPIQFSTYLAGVKADNTPLIFGPGFEWKSNFNGTSGGISTTTGVPGQAADPNGTGGITVTNVNLISSYANQGGAPSGPTLLTGSQVTVTASGLAYSRVTQTFNGSVTVTNISNEPLVGPFSIVIDSLTPTVTVAGAAGQFGGWSYVTIPAALSLTPGQSAAIGLQFKNPSNVVIDFLPLIFTWSFTQ